MLKNLDKKDFGDLSNNSTLGLNAMNLSIQLPFISIGIILPALLPMFFIENALVNQMNWKYVSLFFKVLVCLVLIYNVIVAFSNLKYKRPDIVVASFGIYMFLVMLTILTVFGVFIEEAVGSKVIFYYGIIGLLPLIYIYSIYRARKRIIDGQLRDNIDGLLPSLENNFFFRNKEILLKIIVVIMIASVILKLALYTVIPFTILLAYFLRHLFVVVYFKSYCLRRFYERPDKEEIEALRKKVRNVTHKKIEKKESYSKKKPKSMQFVLFIIKPIQYVLFYGINFLGLIMADMFKGQIIGLLVSALIIFLLAFYQLKWIIRYNVSFIGRRLVSVNCILLSLNIAFILIGERSISLENDPVLFYSVIGTGAVIVLFWFLIDPVKRLENFYYK